MDRAILRILDANLNRAREAVRVMEDYARFALDEGILSRGAKQIRHDLADLADCFPAAGLVEARDTPGDVGTEITTINETTRRDERDVVVAAAKRLTEALRCLEEYSKIDNTAAAKGFESLRYQTYELEKNLLARSDPAGRFSKVKLYVLLTEKLCRKAILDVAAAAVAGGADCIQLREKDKSDEEVLELAGKVGEICRQGGVLLAMNDRADLAMLAGADVVHLGQGDVSVAQARKIVPPATVVGKSTHNINEVTAAAAQGPDYIAVGSVFASTTKTDVELAGPEMLGLARKVWQGPIIAIGGITVYNAAEAITAGADAVALCQAVIGCEDPAGATRAVREAVLAGAER